MKNKVFLQSILLSAFFVVGSALVKSDTLRWYIVSMPEIVLDTVEDTQRPYLQFDLTEERFSGFAGCNRIFGSFKQRQDTLTVGMMASTRMLCEDMSVEEAFFAHFTEGDYVVERNDSVMVLQGEHGAEFVLKMKTKEKGKGTE